MWQTARKRSENMKLKNKWKRFWTLERHANHGFTLVELVVVIAIMGILAGAGTAGYAGYVKQANKKADMTLVGNVQRAIEVGVYSTMFGLDDSFTLSGVEYPVGYVVLSTDGNMQTKASDVKAHEVSGECVFSDPVTVVSIEKTNKTYNCSYGWGCSHSDSQYIYSKDENPIRYCLTHSKNQPAPLAATTLYSTGYTMSHSSYRNHPFTSTGSFTLEAGTFVAGSGISQLYVEDSDGKCVLAANNGVDAGAIVTDGEGDNPIFNALTAAFGAGLSETKLKYDGWTADEGVNYATFLSSSGEMVQLVKDTHEDLEDMLDIINGVNAWLPADSRIDTSNYLSKDYEDSSDMMESFANHVYDKYPTKDAWKTVWAGAATYSGVDYTFGMSDAKYHHDYVYSANKAYNQSFGSYCEANGVDPTYVAAIYDFKSTPNESALSGVDSLAYIPRTVNTAAFNGVTGVNADYTLKNAFLNVSNTDTDEAALAAFEQCKTLYERYIDDSNGPSACEKNGDAFHAMMETLYKTSGAARDADNVAGGDYFDYYDNYLGAMNAIYSGVETATKNGNVVVLVTVQDGVVKCDVSPSAANPRNKD